MQEFWAPCHKPASNLGRYRNLSPLASVHVSPLVLGGLSIGDKYQKHGLGAMNKEDSFKLLDAFYEKGGNFIDTANYYQDESSEEFIGEWAESRDIRDQLVIATKFTTNFKRGQPNYKIQANYTGNSMKSLHLSVEASLKKLRTSYIDILYIHWWDYNTSVEEIMNSLHILVGSRKVLYLGASDCPAWMVAKANQYARDHGKSPFVIYQGLWNVMTRDFEREILPMARHEGLALAPWNVLQSGKFRTDEEEELRAKSGEKGRTLYNQNWQRSPEERKMSLALEKVAKEVGAKHITAVAIAYLLHKAPYVFPIVGGRKIEQLEGNIEALEISLSPEQIEYLEGIISFNSGFPTNVAGDGRTNFFILGSGGAIDKVPLTQPIPAISRL